MIDTKIFKSLIFFFSGWFVFSSASVAFALSTVQGTCADLGCSSGEFCYLCTSSTNPSIGSASYICAQGDPSNTERRCTFSESNALLGSNIDKLSHDAAIAATIQSDTQSLIAIFGRNINVDSILSDISDKIKTNTSTNQAIADFIKLNLVKSNSSLKEGNITVSNNDLNSYYKEERAKAGKLQNEYEKLLGEVDSKYGCDTKDLADRIAKNLLGSRNFSFMNYTLGAISNCKKPIPQDERDQLIDIVRKFDGARFSHHYLEDLRQEKSAIFQYWYCTLRDEDGNCTGELGHIDFIVNDDYSTITSISGTSQGCLPLPFKLYEARSCLFCPLFDVLFTAIQKASTEAYEMFANPFAKILLVGLAIWIALMVLRHVSAMSEQKTLEFLTNLFTNSFKVVIVYILLMNSSIVYNIIIGPLLKAGFDFGMVFLERSRGTISSCQLESSAVIGGVFPNYVYSGLRCFIQAVQYELAAVEAIGSSLMCVARHTGKKDIVFIAHIMPDFAMMLKGAIIWLTAFVISIAFGFYLVDAVIQLGIFGMLLPLLLASFPFSLTRKYFTTGVGVFMNSWFIFVFMGLVTNICIKLIGESLTNGQGGFTAVEAAINGNDVNVLKNLLDYGSAGLILLIACCVISVKLMGKVTSLAGTLGDSGLNLQIGNKLGGLAASGVTNAAKWGAGKAGSAVKGIGNARIFGKDGKEWSIMDKVRGARHSAARAVGKTIGGVGKAVASPVRFTKSLFSGKSRRTPPTP